MKKEKRKKKKEKRKKKKGKDYKAKTWTKAITSMLNLFFLSFHTDSFLLLIICHEILATHISI